MSTPIDPRTVVLTDGSTTSRPGADDGFTLVEVLVAVAIIALVMLGLGGVFVATASGTDAQGQQQAAVRLATAGLDNVRAMAPATLATTLPTATEKVVVDGLEYRRSYTAAVCQLTTANVCQSGAAAGTVPMLRVTVSIGWTGKSCARSACTYSIGTLIDTGTVDPVFDVTDKAQAPVLGAVADQVQDVGEAVTGPVLTVAGGTRPLAYTASGLPSGVSLDPSTGALTAPTLRTASPSRTVTVTVTDAFGLYSTTTFAWTVNALPALTAATLPVPIGALTPIDLASALKLAGGSPAFTWSCGTLPAGLSVDRATGSLTGTLAGVGVVPVTCTVTDARGRSATATLSLTVLAPLTVTAPVNGTIATVSRSGGVSGTATATGCSGACTWSASGLPPALTLDATTGVLTARPNTLTLGAVYRFTLTVTDGAKRTAASAVTWTVGR